MLNRLLVAVPMSVLLGALSACEPSTGVAPATPAPPRVSSLAVAAAECAQIVDQVENETIKSLALVGTESSRDLAVSPKARKAPTTFEMTPAGQAVYRDKSAKARPEVARRLTLLAQAFKDAQYADQLCNTRVLSVAVQLQRGAAEAALNGVAPGFDPVFERANTPAALAAIARADALAASTTGMLAALGMVSLGANAKAADDLSRSLAKALRARPAPSKSDADTFWAFATRKAREFSEVPPVPQQAEPEHPGPVLDIDPADANKAKTLREDPKAVHQAAIGLFRQDHGAAMHVVVVLFPSDSPVRTGLGAANALTRNDFSGALWLARRMVTPGSDVGKALAALDDPPKE